MRFLKISFLLLAICFLLTSCDQEFWSQPGAFGLPLGVVMMCVWMVVMIRGGSNKTETESSDLGSSNLIECNTCNQKVSKNANTCPHCGEPNFQPPITRSQENPLGRLNERVDSVLNSNQSIIPPKHNRLTGSIVCPYCKSEMSVTPSPRDRMAKCANSNCSKSFVVSASP